MSSKRFALIVNPRGGRTHGLAILERIKPIFDAAGASLEIFQTEYSGHATQIARTIDLAGKDGICVVGGDGTIHEVVNGVLQRGEPFPLPLGIIPAGTGNTIHQELECEDPIQAARKILEGRRSRIDAIRVTLPSEVIYCLNIVGWGAVADINHTANRMRVLGSRRYALAALWHVARGQFRSVRIVRDGQESNEELAFAIACNTKNTGRGMKLAPLAKIDDGLIDLVVLRRCSRFQMLKLFAKVFDGSHLSMPAIDYQQVRSFAILDEGCEPLNLDGEIKGNSPLSAVVMPKAIEVFA